MLVIADAFQALPAGLREDLLTAFGEITKNYREHRWEPSELNGGKLCEAAFTVVDGYLQNKSYPARAHKPTNFLKSCLDLEKNYPSTPENRSARILIPRMMVGLYDIRNNRGVGHAGAEVNPNHMDATAVLYGSKWLLAELVRLLHSLAPDEAANLVETIVEREVPWIWSHENMKRVLKPGLTWKQQTLVLMLTETGEVLETSLLQWLEHRSVTDYRKNVLRPMHKARLIDYDTTKRTVRLLPPGVASAEGLLTE